MLDDDDPGQGEVGDDLPGGIAVHDVIVGELLPLELTCIGEGRKPRVPLPVEGGLLMGVLPVTEVLRLGELEGEGVGEFPFFRAFAAEQPEVVGDGAVVAGRELEGLFRQLEIGRFRDLAPRLLHLRDDLRVILRIGDDGDEAVVLRGRAEHRGAADIDVFDGVLQGAAFFGDGVLEAVEVDDDHVDQV